MGIQDTILPRSGKPLASAPLTNDIRFVETTGNRHPRRLGRGLAGVARWHGVTQFTYFQQLRRALIGPPGPVSIEITYGLEPPRHVSPADVREYLGVS